MLSLLLLTNTADAWNHTYRIWNREQLPLEWHMSDYRTAALDNDYQLDVIEESYDNWVNDVPCAQLSHEYMGVREGHSDCDGDPEECVREGRTSSDLMNTFYYDDPDEEQGGGVLGVTYTVTTGQVAFRREGNEYYYASDSDIVFSKDVAWVSSDQGSNACSGTPIEAVATHEIGHQWGMGHSCEEDDVTSGDCEGDELFGANMFWSAPQCASFNPEEVFTSDDVEGMNALYGPYATFAASTNTYGGVPLEVCFELSSTSAISEVNWIFGDGSDPQKITLPEDPTDEDYTICHEYEEKGQFTVNVTIIGESDDCGSWEYTDRQRAMVVACEPPAAADGFNGMFSYTPDEGLIYQMVNQADTTVYGCIDRVQWDVFKGGELVKSVSAWSPKIEFPEEGDYKVVLNLGGPGGVTAEELDISVAFHNADSGCSATGHNNNALFFAGLLVLLPVAVRRERISG